MSKIYAPLNSVNTYRTVKTVLPLDVSLSKEEARELMELEKLVATSGFTPQQLISKFNIVSTENVGIYYFCIEKCFALRKLAKNPNISPLIAYLIERKVSEVKPNDELGTRHALLFNPVVYNDKFTFKAVFANVAKGLDMMYALAPLLAKADISVFMLLLAEMGDTDTSDNVTSGVNMVTSTYTNRAFAREEEIHAWAKEFAPDFSELPLSWILKVYGL